MGVANISGNILTDSGASLSSYLPLTGGTLTGTLNGTSATFSSSVTATSEFISITGFNAKGNGSDTAAVSPYYLLSNTAGNRQWISQLGASNEYRLHYYNGTSWSNPFTIASTGAATFSSSVKSVGRIFSTSDASFGDMLSTTGSIVMSYDSGGQQGYLTSRNYSTSTDTPLNFGASKHIFSGGNVGIGTSSPQNLLHIKAGSSGLASYDARYKSIIENNGEAYYVVTVPDNSYAGLRILGTSTSGKAGFEYYMTDDNLLIYSNGYQRFMTAGTERMRITSDGAVLVGASSTPSSSVSGVALQNPRLLGPTLFSSGNVSDSRSFVQFINANGVVGQITTSGTSTSYVTSSDYRLKQDLKDYNGLHLVSAIKTYDYEWKSDNTRSYGVLAHELEEVIPQAVYGEKDGEEMQGVDYSKLVPILIKSIQELSAKVTALENK